MSMTIQIDDMQVADAIAADDLNLLEVLTSLFYQNDPDVVLRNCADLRSGSIAELEIAPHLRKLADLIEADD